jgi:hypothetical protein
MTEDEVRAIGRDEISSLAGKALRRTQDQELSRSPERNMMVEIANRESAQFWAEVLAEYSGVTIEDEKGKFVGGVLPPEK